MAVVGLIAEYDPFHRGHKWQLDAIRERMGGDTTIVVAMSGNVVQRGELAVVDKWSRAEMAVLGGADLVLELPAPWASATAERFAEGGVGLLAATGLVDTLAFGCEEGDAAPLMEAAKCLNSDTYDEKLRQKLREGMSFAVARESAVWDICGDAALLLEKPNNNLAVEYLRVLERSGSGIVPLALPRVGAGHNSEEISELASASLVRKRLFAGEPWEELVPEATAEILRRERRAGRCPVALKNIERAVLAVLRTREEDDFAPLDGGGEGLYHRFYDAIHRAVDLESICAEAKTKRYSMARIHRMVLHSFLGFAPAKPSEPLPYLRVLAADQRGRAALKRMKGCADLPVLTKAADAGRIGEREKAAVELEARITDIYTLAYPVLSEAAPGREFRTDPKML